jgi:hypothetical protein
MSEPTQAELDVVAIAIDAACDTMFAEQDQARAAIEVLDKLRGLCVPVNVLLAEIGRMSAAQVTSAEDVLWKLNQWLDRKGWLDG